LKLLKLNKPGIAANPNAHPKMNRHDRGTLLMLAGRRALLDPVDIHFG
jgi:hypothetical protein